MNSSLLKTCPPRITISIGVDLVNIKASTLLAAKMKRFWVAIGKIYMNILLWDLIKFIARYRIHIFMPCYYYYYYPLNLLPT